MDPIAAHRGRARRLAASMRGIELEWVVAEGAAEGTGSPLCLGRAARRRHPAVSRRPSRARRAGLAACTGHGNSSRAQSRLRRRRRPAGGDPRRRRDDDDVAGQTGRTAARAGRAALPERAPRGQLDGVRAARCDRSGSGRDGGAGAAPDARVRATGRAGARHAGRSGPARRTGRRLPSSWGRSGSDRVGASRRPTAPRAPIIARDSPSGRLSWTVRPAIWKPNRGSSRA